LERKAKVTVAPENFVEVDLYFEESPFMKLSPEKRKIFRSDGSLELAERILNELKKGPETGDLSPTIPEGKFLRAFFIDSSGCAFVDFSADFKKNHPGGTHAELITVYSIVNSLVFNMDSVKRVQFLVDGEQVETLAGHVDIRHPWLTLPLVSDALTRNTYLFYGFKLRFQGRPWRHRSLPGRRSLRGRILAIASIVSGT
jgi:hypothetical protein